MIKSSIPCPVCGGHEWLAYWMGTTAMRVDPSDPWIDYPEIAKRMPASGCVEICQACECTVSTGGIFSQRGEP